LAKYLTINICFNKKNHTKFNQKKEILSTQHIYIQLYIFYILYKASLLETSYKQKVCENRKVDFRFILKRCRYLKIEIVDQDS